MPVTCPALLIARASLSFTPSEPRSITMYVGAGATLPSAGAISNNDTASDDTRTMSRLDGCVTISSVRSTPDIVETHHHGVLRANSRFHHDQCPAQSRRRTRVSLD